MKGPLKTFRIGLVSLINNNRYTALVITFIALYTLSLSMGEGVRIHQTLWHPLPFRYALGFMLWLIPVVTLSLFLSKHYPAAEPNIFTSTALLTGLGILTIWRLQPSLALRQNVWWFTSIPLALVLLSRKIDIRSILLKYRWPLVLTGMLVTGLTIVIGIYPSGVGPQLWLNIGGVIFQPSEILKPILIIFLAGIFSSDNNIRKPSHLFLLSFLVIGISLSFFSIQKDLGTASILISIYVFMLFHFSKKKWILGIALLAFIAALIIGYTFIPLVHQRIATWINPWNDPTGTSYQVTQSMIAIAAGGILGTGPNLGSPTLIPLAHSDFIYSAIAEELGVGGSFLILCTFLFLAFSISLTHSKTKYSFEHYFSVGVAYYLAIQSFLIIAGNIKLLPLTGVTLPLISSGGSSMLTTLFCVFTVIRFNENRTLMTGKSLFPEWKKVDVSYPLITAMFLALLLFQVNWSTIQQRELTLRPENLRPLVADLYSPRGSIFDRNGTILAATTGESGSFEREYFSAAVSHMIGYSDIDLGQSGVERYQNEMLRGETTHDSIKAFISDSLYNHHPAGSDLMLSIDSELQIFADHFFQMENGAAVMTNPTTGEILLLYSSPGYEPNDLNALIDTYRTDSYSPLLNRATMGLYPPATMLTPIYALNHLSTNPELPPLPNSYRIFRNGDVYECADKGIIAARWSDAIQAGCPAVTITLAKFIQDPDSFLDSSGLLFPLELDLEMAPLVTLPDGNNMDELSLGIMNFMVSPLKMAYVYSVFYNADDIPSLTYVISDEYNTEQSEFSINVNPSPYESVAKLKVMALLQAEPNSPFWYALGSNLSGDSRNIWFVGGTINSGDGTDPLLVVVMLENDDAEHARNIGLGLLTQAMILINQ